MTEQPLQAVYAVFPATGHLSAQARAVTIEYTPGAAKAGAAEAGTPAAEEDHDQALAELEKVTDGKAKLEGVARLAEQAQPKGSTLDSAGVHTPVSSSVPAAGHLWRASLPDWHVRWRSVGACRQGCSLQE